MKRSISLLWGTLLSLMALSSSLAAQSWVSLNGPNITNNVRDITFDNGGANLYVAEGSYVVKSTNSGTAWRGTAGDFVMPLVVACKPDNASIVVAAKADTLKQSIDGGQTWTNLSEVSANLIPLRFAASTITGNTNKMYLGRLYHGSTESVWKSTDAGATWARSQNFIWRTNVNDITTYPVGDGVRNNWLWVCGADPDDPPEGTNPGAEADERGVWYSPDAGVTWQAGTMGDYSLKAIAVVHRTSPANPHLYVGTTAGGVWKSMDLGNTWTQQTLTPSPLEIRSIRVNTSNNHVIIAANNGVFFAVNSTNAGDSWSQANSGLTETNVKSLAVHSSSNTVYAGTVGSLFKSTYYVTTYPWTNIGLMNVSSVEATSTDVWAVSRDNSYCGKYNGANWTNSYISSAGAAFSSEHIYRNPHSGYLFVAGALGGTARVFYSTNGGGNFAPVSYSYTIASGSCYYRMIAHPNGRWSMEEFL